MTISRDQILKFMKHPDYRPMRRVPLAEGLSDDEDEQREVGRLLRVPRAWLDGLGRAADSAEDQVADVA